MNPHDEHPVWVDAIVFLAIVIFTLFAGTVWMWPS